MTVAAPSRWRASPGRLAVLLTGLTLFGAGDGLFVVAALGNSPWTVLAEGVAKHTVLGIGTATIAISLVVMVGWLPLHVRPGLGTVANTIVIGLALGAVLEVLPRADALGVQLLALAGGTVLIGVGSGLYLGMALGPGPRDGLMTGLHRRTGAPIALVRGGLEGSATVLGALLGGTVGPGTLVFALMVGPSVATGLRLLSRTPAADL